MRELRLTQGIDTFTLANRCAISERQVQELEGMGDGGFYSEAIKYQTGLKLLRYLGDDTAIGTEPSQAVRVSGTRRAAATLPLTVAPPFENYKLLLNIGIALTLCGALISLVNVVDGLGLRPGGILLTVIGVGMMILIHQGRNSWAVMLLCWGFLIMNFFSALLIRGLGNVSWLAIPIAIMAAGWFMGRTMAWMVAAVGSLEAVGLYVLHVKNYAFAVELPPESMLAAAVAACAVAALIGGAISQTYGRQFELISESRAELHAVMDSTRAMIWSVSAVDFSLRTFNRVFEKEILAKLTVQVSLSQLPEEVFGSAELGDHWNALYLKALEKEGLALEDHIFGNERLFEVSFQPIRKENRVIGLSIYAQDITERA